MASKFNDDLQDELSNFLGEHRITINNSSSINTFPGTVAQVGISEINTAQVAINKFSSTHGDISQNSSLHTGIGDKYIVQAATSQNSSFKIGLGNSGFLEISSPDVRLLQKTFIKIGVDQSSFAQIGNTKDSSTEMRVSQVSTSQISTFTINSLEISVNNADSTQVSTSKFTSAQTSSVQNQIAQVNPTEIPLPSSITLQQFLSSHNFNLQNTTIPTWTEFFTGTTPFNLNIQITDLPTGHPTSGTPTQLLRRPYANDDDANGLGCFRRSQDSIQRLNAQTLAK